MNAKKRMIIRWSFPLVSTYNHIHLEKIAQPLLLSDGIVALNGPDLVKLDFEGKLIWRCPHDYGFWGSPVKLNPENIVCATSDNTICWIDQTGKIVNIMNLPTSVTTAILVSDSGDLWFGMGASECVVARIDSYGKIIYSQVLARDQGLQYPLVPGFNNDIWIPTNQGLVCIDAQSGEELISVSLKSNLNCISAPLVFPDSVFITAMISDSSCALVQINNSGQILTQHSLPNLLRAQLLPVLQGGLWLIGSTVSFWKPVLESDQTLIIRFSPNGKLEYSEKLVAQRSIEAMIDFDGILWLGTYTYNDQEDQESGELIAHEGFTVTNTKWIPKPQAGVGFPLFYSNDHGILSTSTALVGFVIQ